MKKIIRKIAAGLTAAVMAVASVGVLPEGTLDVLTISAGAEEVASGTCGDPELNKGRNVTWSLDDQGTLTISGNGEMITGYSPWRDYSNYIKKVVIKNGVTTLRESAFSGYPVLTSVEIPASITSIGRDAFIYCTNLIEINVSSGNKNYSSVKGILLDKAQKTIVYFPYAKEYILSDIPGTVTAIGRGAFFGSNRTNITIPATVTSIEDFAFADNYYLTDIAIPDSVRSVGNNAFSFCESLKSATVGANVESVGESVFKACLNLTDVNIKNGAAMIGDHMFDGCDGLISITVPGSVRSIGKYAFYRCTNLMKVTLGKGVESIGDDAFYDCSCLAEINIPDSVTSIGESVFVHCTSLAGIDIPDSVTSIGDMAFLGCTRLTGFTLPDGITKINASTFSECTRLESIYIPDSVTSMAYGVFKNCSSLKSIYFAGTKDQWIAITGRGYASFPEGCYVYYNIYPFGAPTVTATAGENSVTLTWNAVSGATKYAVSDVTGETALLSNKITATSYTITGLTAGKTYSYTVKAYNGKKWSDASATVTATPIAAFGAPTVTAKGGENSITLSWNAVPGALKYAVLDATDPTTGAVLLSNKITTTSYTVGNLTNGQSYSFVVKVYNGKKWSDASNVASATPVAPFVAPTVTAKAGEGSVTLTWNAVPGAVKYAVFDASSAAAAPVLLSNKITTTSYTVGNLTNGQTYSFVVKAYNGKKWSAESKPASAIPTAAFSAPTVTAKAGEGKIILSWNAVPGAVKYAVFDASSAAAAPVLLSNKITKTSYTVGNLTNGQTYSFVVKAYNGKKWSAESKPASAIPTAAFSAPTVTARVSGSTVTLAWDAVPGAVKYAVKRVDGSTVTLLSNKITTPTFAVKNLAPGSYTYVVQAYNGKKWSADSAAVTATVK